MTRPVCSTQLDLESFLSRYEADSSHFQGVGFVGGRRYSGRNRPFNMPKRFQNVAIPVWHVSNSDTLITYSIFSFWNLCVMHEVCDGFTWVWDPNYWYLNLAIIRLLWRIEGQLSSTSLKLEVEFSSTKEELIGTLVIQLRLERPIPLFSFVSLLFFFYLRHNTRNRSEQKNRETEKTDELTEVCQFGWFCQTSVRSRV